MGSENTNKATEKIGMSKHRQGKRSLKKLSFDTFLP